MDSRPEIDLLLAGTVFFDVVFTGFPGPPEPGTEVWTEGMGSSPGGIANLAIAASRLGLQTSLAAGFGDDLYADWLWGVLRDQERVDLAPSRRHAGTHTPVSVALSYDGDRAFVTHGHPWPTSIGEMLAEPPRSRAVIVDVGDEATREESWWRRCADGGSRVFASAGWDPSQAWDGRILEALDHCHAFVPNAVEAMGYTRTDDPDDALVALAERVPLAVVTRGSEGVAAIDSSTGERASIPAVPVDIVDTTGAGDVFLASLVLGTLSGWSLQQRLAFSSLCAGLAVQQVGGSLAAPGWGDVADWWRCQRGDTDPADADADSAPSGPEAALVERYAFLEDVLPGADAPRVRRAEATIARFSDAGAEPESEAARPGPGAEEAW